MTMKKTSGYFILAIFLLIIVTLALMNSCGLSKKFRFENFDNISLDNSRIANSVYGEEKKIDIFSETKGSFDCDKKASNLSNSKGGLCLSNKQMKLMRSRGGNATGVDPMA